MSEQIRLGVDTSDLSAGFQRLKSEAESTLSDMIRKSRNYSTSSKEVLKDIEDQIKALERRNKLEFDLSRRELSSRRDEGQITERQYSKKLGEVAFDEKESKESVRLLKEILQATVETSKEEIRESRADAERKVSAGVAGLSETAALSVLLQQGQLGLEPSTKKENEKSVASGIVRTSIESLGQILTSRNMEITGARMAGQAGGIVSDIGGQVPGVIGMAITAMAGKMEQVIETFQSFSEAQMHAKAIGSSVTAAGASGLSDWGYSAIDYASAIPEISRARGKVSDPTSFLKMQRGMGLDSGSITSVEMMLRNNRGGHSGSGSYIPAAAESMYQSGISNRGDRSLLPEYLSTLVSLGQQQLTELGHVNMTMNMRVASGLAKISEDFKNPQVAANVINKLHQGLSASSSPQQQAFQYSILSQMRKKDGTPLTMFEMEEFRADPFSEQSKQYLPNYMKGLREMSGGNEEQFYFNIMSNFGVTAPMARKLGSGFASKGDDFSSWLDKDFKGSIPGSPVPAHMKEYAESVSKDIEMYNTVTSGFGSVQEYFSNLIESVHENTRAQQEIGTELINSNSLLGKIFGSIIYTAATNPVHIWN